MARSMFGGFNMKAIFPTRALALLLLIGLVDLVATAVLHAQGKIIELNPIMKPIIEHGEWLFALVKGSTLVLGWYFLAQYAKTHLNFVRNACLLGAVAYVGIWTVWFVNG